MTLPEAEAHINNNADMDVVRFIFAWVGPTKVLKKRIMTYHFAVGAVSVADFELFLTSSFVSCEDCVFLRVRAFVM